MAQFLFIDSDIDEINSGQRNPVVKTSLGQRINLIKTNKISPITPVEKILDHPDDIRVHQRVKLKSFVTIIKNNERSNCLIRDISPGGLSISTVGNYKLSDEIIKTFKLSNNITFRNIKGIVKYIEKTGFVSINSKQNFIMGVEFVGLPPEKSRELVDFVNSEQNK